MQLVRAIEIGVVAVLVILASGLLAYEARSLTPTPAAPPAWSATAPSTTRAITIAMDPMSGQFVYSSTTLSVPAHELVTFTIVNFDPGAVALVDRSDARVMGTVGGMMMLGPSGHMMSTAGLDPSGVSHTFSLSNGYYHVNVPIPPASDSGSPSTVTFTAEFDHPGTYWWGCVVPCGGVGMSDETGMYGTITVA